MRAGPRDPGRIRTTPPGGRPVRNPARGRGRHRGYESGCGDVWWLWGFGGGGRGCRVRLGDVGPYPAAPRQQVREQRHGPRRPLHRTALRPPRRSRRTRRGLGAGRLAAGTAPASLRPPRPSSVSPRITKFGFRSGSVARRSAGGPLQQGRHGRRQFDAGQWGADAVVDAGAEGDVRVVRAGEVEAVRGREHRRVVVGGAEQHRHLRAARGGRPVDLDLVQHPALEELERGVVPHQLLHGRRDEGSGRRAGSPAGPDCGTGPASRWSWRSPWPRGPRSGAGRRSRSSPAR